MKEDFKRLALDITEQQYREDSALSYSMIKKYNSEGFKCIETIKETIESSSLTFGSVVDSLVTEGEEGFNSKFIVCDLPKLSDSLKQIADMLVAKTCETDYTEITDIPQKLVSETCVEANYYADPKYSKTRVSKVIEGCGDYYRLAKQSLGKQVVSIQDYNDACRCVEALRTDMNTTAYFSNNPFSDITENLYQLKFKAKYQAIPLRCMVDCLHIDHREKTVTPVDLKTTSMDEWEFPHAFIKYGYWIQAQLYWYIIRKNMDNDHVFKDYTLKNFIFAVINRRNLQPLLWEYPDTQKEETAIYNGKHNYVCRSWRFLAERLWYCLNHNESVPLNINRNGTNDIVSALTIIDDLTI